MNVRKASGFTLVEVMIVLLIGGILLASFGSGLLIYFNNTKSSATKEKLDKINDALNEYLSINQKLPCPASQTADVDTDAFGRPVDELPVSSTDCNDGGSRDGTVLVVGQRDIAVADGGSAGAEQIRIGSVPTRALNLPDEFIYDSYGARFLYAVSADLATDTPASGDGYDPSNGVIDVVDSGGNSLLNPVDSAHYVLLSHGPDQQGGITVSGVTIEACPADPAVGGLDVENCNADSIFRRTILSTDNLGAAQFDDFLIYNNLETKVDIPQGAVVAFNRATCPDGWSLYTPGFGRVIIGSGGAYAPSAGANQNPNDAAITWAEPTTNYPLGSDGGSAHYRMSEPEMFQHDHNVTIQTHRAVVTGGETGSNVSAGAGTASIGIAAPSETERGGTAAMEHLPPYIALRYCQKDP